MRVTATTRIACPPEKVFDMLADLRKDTQWNSRVSRAELQSAESIGEGSRFVIVNGGSEYDVTIDGTELESDFDFRPKGALKVLFPLLAPVIRRDVPKQYASFKALCERSA